MADPFKSSGVIEVRIRGCTQVIASTSAQKHSESRVRSKGSSETTIEPVEFPALLA